MTFMTLVGLWRNGSCWAVKVGKMENGKREKGKREKGKKVQMRDLNSWRRVGEGKREDGRVREK
jgi:hypothetical protein